MESYEKQIHLSSTDAYVTEDARDAFRVARGSVLVFISPLRSDRVPERRLLLCEIPEGKMIPAFSYRDEDWREWRFLLIARETADLICLEGKTTSVLQKKFSQAAGLPHYGQEGFARAMVEYYRRETLKDRVFIGRGKKEEPIVSAASYDVIRQAFEAGEERVTGDLPIYRATAYACRSASIPIVEPEALDGASGEITVESIAYASRFLCRRVVLEPRWNRSDCGVILGSIDGEAVACVPRGAGGYEIYYGASGKREKLTDVVAETVFPSAYVIARALPERALSRRDLLRFGWQSVRKADLLVAALLGLIGVLIGLLLPTLNQKIYDDYIPLGNEGQLVQICLVIATFLITNLFFDMVKRLTDFRIGSRIGYDFQNAVYYRVFHLPERFFRAFDSADLAQRLGAVAGYIRGYAGLFYVSGLSLLFSLLYFYRMFRYAPKLAWTSILLLLAYGAAAFLLSVFSAKWAARAEDQRGRASAKLYQHLSGIEKIRMAGAEDRAAYEYLLPFSERQTAEIRKNRFDTAAAVLSGAAGVAFNMVFYYIIVHHRLSLSTGSFMAFLSAFGAFSAAVLQTVGSAAELFSLRPQFLRFRPVMDTPVEDDGGGEVLDRLTGEISLHQVRFAYEENRPNVLDGIDLQIRPGEYVGIVGQSGCGKSTLLKLLLGFETPVSGKICYDGRDLASLDKRALRRNLGVVLQNGRLISGSIYDNITITAPSASLSDVEAVVEAVGLKEDIERMPMGIHTMLSENSGTISGGQQQRILIARAIISRPAILIFDEATSALDNVTQAAVCDSLDRMSVTRIVVAHRLSTIKNCDRILVLQNGTIAEEGTYDSLMAKGGIFAGLAERQLVE